MNLVNMSKSVSLLNGKLDGQLKMAVTRLFMVMAKNRSGIESHRHVLVGIAKPSHLGRGLKMISTKLMIALMVQYIVIALFGVYEGNWIRSLYFLGATLITVAVLQLK